MHTISIYVVWGCPYENFQYEILFSYHKNFQIYGNIISMYQRITPYICEKFRLTKISPKPSYLCIAEILGRINFCQCGKGHHILCVIINTFT